MKWQQAAVLLTGILVLTGLITYTDLFGVLFQLAGVNYTYTGDIYCNETCESYINVTSWYWRICFAHYNNTKYENETLFKKMSRSRTLHMNLDNVENIISTEPRVEVDWLVPTYGKNWRNIKDGDCWDRGKINKIKLIGHKEPEQTVKWNFEVGDYVDIDPKWIGIKGIEFDKSIVGFSEACSYYNVDYKNLNDIETLNVNSVKAEIGKINNIRIEWLINVSNPKTIYEYGECKRTINCDKGLNFTHCYLEEDIGYNLIKCDKVDNLICYYAGICKIGSYTEDKGKMVYKPILTAKGDLTNKKYNILELTNNYKKINKDKLKIRICGDIERELTKNGWEIAIDHIPEFKGTVYNKLAWWNNSWLKCKNITITNTGSTTLTNFPAYINLTYDSDMQSDYDDIRFVNTSCNNGGSELDYEIENYTTASVHCWVEIDSLPTPSKVISVYYNNSGASSGENPTGVWDENYLGVWHMNEVDVNDSTSNNHDGTQIGGVASSSSGAVGRCTFFDETDDQIQVSDFLYGPEFTWEFWYNDDDWTGPLYEYPISHGTYNAQPSFNVFIREDQLNNPGNLAIRLRDSDDAGSTSIDGFGTNATLMDGEWHHYVIFTDTGVGTKNYIDGKLNGSDTEGGDGFDVATPIYFGSRADNDSSRYYGGYLDEIRLSNVTRSVDWINQTYQLIFNQGTYVTLGTEEINPCVYSGSGSWNIKNDCNITSTNLKGNDLHLNCPNYINIIGNLTNIGDIYLKKGCNVTWNADEYDIIMG